MRWGWTLTLYAPYAVVPIGVELVWGPNRKSITGRGQIYFKVLFVHNLLPTYTPLYLVGETK